MTWPFIPCRPAITPAVAAIRATVLQIPDGPKPYGYAPIMSEKKRLTAAIRVRAQQQPRYRRRVYLETNLGLAKAICSGDV